MFRQSSPLPRASNFIPEVGYDYMDDAAGKEQGYQWYVGVEWEIHF